MGFLSNLFSRKKEEPADLTNAGPVARSLRRCKRCDAIGLLIGYGAFIFSSGRSRRKHDCKWVLISEQNVIDARYGGSELSYLKDVDEMFKDPPRVLYGLLQKNSEARLVRAEVLERIAELEGKIPSEEAESHYYRAILIYSEALAHDLAAKELEKAVELAPDNMRYRNQLATQHFLNDNWQRAEKTWIEILRLYPDDEDTISNYTAALTQMAEKDPEQKIAYYKKAFDLQPKSQLRLRNLGIACREASRWEEAIVYLKEAITYATEPLDEASIEDFKASIKDRIAICYFNIGKKLWLRKTGLPIREAQCFPICGTLKQSYKVN